ncbi:hypothetical protein J4450_03815 [Candidatus Micrarchaeota archaeon]|nr:hypothetical protein [Candidatus Micrarchaeota archaeon]
MENVTLNMVYEELTSLRKDVKRIEETIICEEKISEKEKTELQKELALAMKEKGTNFRDVKRK